MSDPKLTKRREALPSWIPWIPVGAAVFVGMHVAGNGFTSDDFLHLFKMANGPFGHAVLAPHGGHWLVSFNLVIGLLHSLFGLNSGPYFVVALLVHAASVRLSFAIIEQATGQPYLAAFGATLWGMCPLLPGSLGSISVHGHVYATAAILWVVYEIGQLAEDDRRLTTGMLVRTHLLLLLAASSFGVGLGVAAGFCAVVFVWNPVPRQRIRLTVAFGLVTLTTAILYFATTQLWVESGGSPGSGIEVATRWLGTAPRRLLNLFAFGISGLLLGPAMIGEVALVSARQVSAVAFPTGILSAFVIAYGLLVSKPEARRQISALILLAFLCYAPIAAARWSNMYGLSAATRYHNLSLAILAAVICLVLSSIAGQRESFRRSSRLFFALWISVGLIPYAIASPRVSDRALKQHRELAGARLRLRQTLDDHKGRPMLLIPNTPFRIGPDRFFAPSDFPGLAAVFIILYPQNAVDGTSVFFVTNPKQRAQLLEKYKGSRLSELLVAEPTRRHEGGGPKRPRTKGGSGKR